MISSRPATRIAAEYSVTNALNLAVIKINGGHRGICITVGVQVCRDVGELAVSPLAIKDEFSAAHTNFRDDVHHSKPPEESISDFVGPSGTAKIFKLDPRWVEIVDGVKDLVTMVI
ncbi:hypothetical protein PV04_08513 [Phialophora macrospora]|uniref:Uncharacterized protein n=1 Tax=Phialophora macrospora TaxID=1851006 RepID=A0A0D2CEM2_9EURO|nr:hypothetical protein PV04_08513 [Phialophora macrospora]